MNNEVDELKRRVEKLERELQDFKNNYNYIVRILNNMRPIN